MNVPKIILLNVFSLVALTTVSAQEPDSIPNNELDQRVVPNMEVDTTAMDMEGLELMDIMDSQDKIQDNPLMLLKGQKTYALNDHAQAAAYDSLWLKELYNSASLYDSIYADIATMEIDTLYYTNVDTDTLKARLALLNQRTPFNIAYNPSLENVIRSFLTRRRGLMERMLTISQFYFPLFEQELDNQNIPLEIGSASCRERCGT